MIKFVHAADLHLDAPFAGLTPEQAVQLRQEQRELPGRLAKLCREEGAELLLLSGDVFDSSHVYRQTLDALHKAFSDCGAQVFVAPGNHDPMTDQSVWNVEIWEPNIHIFTEPQIRSVYLDQLNCTVYGAAFTTIDCPPLLDGFHADGSGLRLMVLHGDVDRPNSVYNPISVEQIAGSGLDYLALGHNHSCSGSRRVGRTTYAWPGCAQGRGYDECGEKGAFVGELDSTGVRLRFVPLGGRKYIDLEIDLENTEIDDVLQKIPTDSHRDCYRITLNGETDADIPTLERQLRERFFSLRLLDKTSPPADIWAGLESDDLRGLFLQGLRTELDRTADPDEINNLKRAAKLGIDLMDGREVTI